jgi:hypothetical protein
MRGKLCLPAVLISLALLSPTVVFGDVIADQFTFTPGKGAINVTYPTRGSLTPVSSNSLLITPVLLGSGLSGSDLNALNGGKPVVAINSGCAPGFHTCVSAPTGAGSAGLPTTGTIALEFSDLNGITGLSFTAGEPTRKTGSFLVEAQNSDGTSVLFPKTIQVPCLPGDRDLQCRLGSTFKYVTVQSPYCRFRFRAIGRSLSGFLQISQSVVSYSLQTPRPGMLSACKALIISWSG